MPYSVNKITERKDKMETSDSAIEKELYAMTKMLDDIYGKKSSDEYKMAGDITKSPVYDDLEKQIAELSTLKGFPKNEAKEFQDMFNALHKPLYKKMVSEFIKKPNEKNITFTAIFTSGYRLLVGEMGRVYASTEATPDGIIYVPDKTTPNEHNRAFLRAFNGNMEAAYNNAIRNYHGSTRMTQEGALLSGIGSALTAFSAFVQAHEIIPITAFFRDVFGKIFGARKILNPISYINHTLTENYDKRVRQFKNACDLYEETKKAYEEYKAAPGRKSSLIDMRYQKNIKKYNIQMKNLQAQIKHYDSRAMAEEEAKKDQIRLEKKSQREAERKRQQEEKGKPKPSPKPSSSDSDDDGDKGGGSSSSPKPTPVDTGDLDF